MNKFKMLIGTLGVLCSFQLQATPIPVGGSVSYDAPAQRILTGDSIYASLSIGIGLTYQETLALIASDASLSGFSIATEIEADALIDALIGTNPCSSQPTGGANCSQNASWQNGLLGDNSDNVFDLFLYLADFPSLGPTLPGDSSSVSIIGGVQFTDSGDGGTGVITQQVLVANFDPAYSSPGASWLLVSNDVPEPGILALFGAGLIGIGAVRRRRHQSR